MHFVACCCNLQLGDDAKFSVDAHSSRPQHGGAYAFASFYIGHGQLETGLTRMEREALLPAAVQPHR